MQEHDTRAVAKTNAEFITPLALRKFLAKKVQGDNLTVLEPAIGSGQLLFELANRIDYIDGFDVNPHAIEIANDNFTDKITTYQQDFILADINKQYDVAIANYPFSLKPTQEHKEYLSQHHFLKQFYNKEKKEKGLFDEAIEYNIKPEHITGKLDMPFILKSFYHAQEGHYFAFPGIAYRNEEARFRKWLIDNKYIKEVGILNNCKFDHTSISILYLHLTKEPNEQTKTFNLDFKTDKLIEGVAEFPEGQFDYPKEVIEKEQYNPLELEIQCREALKQHIRLSLERSQMIYDLDNDIRQNLSSVVEFKQELIDWINES